MLSVASMMSLNDIENFDFDEDNRASNKKGSRLSGSFPDTSKYIVNFSKKMLRQVWLQK